MPFLPRPQKLKGMVGDKGFDPLGLSDWVPVEWLRESELKAELTACAHHAPLPVPTFARLHALRERSPAKPAARQHKRVIRLTPGAPCAAVALARLRSRSKCSG